MRYFPAALTIAGSDSGGGAGIQMDVKTFQALGVFGCSVITAVTAQNPREVRRIDPLPPASVKEQARAVLAKFAVGALKTGMLFNSGIIAAAAEAVRATGKNMVVVVDPVMVATSGARLLKPDAVSALRRKLLPLADWITPNIPEAEALTGHSIRSLADMAAAAEECSERWNCGCIVKGGHMLDGGRRTDVISFRGESYAVSAPDVPVKSSHGTGCAFSAAIAAGFAKGLPWKDALLQAKSFVYGALLDSVRPGPGIAALAPPVKNRTGAIRLEKC